MNKYFYPIIENLGGYKSVYEKLKKLGYSATTRDTVRMWANPNRGTIPGKAVPLLMLIAQNKGVKYTPEDFQLQKATG